MLELQDLVFAILVAKNQLVTLVRPKKYSLHPSGEGLFNFIFILDMFLSPVTIPLDWVKSKHD